MSYQRAMDDARWLSERSCVCYVYLLPSGLYYVSATIMRYDVVATFVMGERE